MKHGEHHLHQRKRIHVLHQKFPNPDPRIKFLDDLVMVVAVIMPLTSLPQIHTIWVLQNAQGVSLLTWSLFFIMAIPMLIYGVVHREKWLIILNVLWLVMYALVITGTIIFR
jgi:uncharacterized protein with PQ loop repeat